MAYERFGKEHLALTSVIERYFGADAGYLDISCLDVARAVLQAGWTKPVLCKDCKYYEIHRPKVLENCERNGHLIPMKPDDFCSYGERREGE